MVVHGYIGMYGGGFFVKCIRSHSKWCRSLSKRTSVSSSHLDSSCPHISSHSNSLSIEVPGTRWFPTDCHYSISGFLHTQWSCSCHSVHSHSGRTNPTWLWVSHSPTLMISYNSQYVTAMFLVRMCSICAGLSAANRSGIRRVKIATFAWLQV